MTTTFGLSETEYDAMNLEVQRLRANEIASNVQPREVILADCFLGATYLEMLTKERDVLLKAIESALEVSSVPTPTSQLESRQILVNGLEDLKLLRE